MSKPPAGRYAIYCRIISPTGAKLALTFQGQDQSVTATPLTYSNNQLWYLKDWNSTTSSFSPSSNTHLQIGWGSDSTPVVLPQGGYVWTIANSDTGYTIQDGGTTVYWFLDEQWAGPGSGKVSISPYDQGVYGRWVFERR